MLDFTQNMNRIERLKHQVTLDMEAEDYHAAREHLASIHVYTAQAQILLEQLRFGLIPSDTTVEDSGQ